MQRTWIGQPSMRPCASTRCICPKAVDEARALGIEALKDEAYSRAMGWRGRASDILLMFLIKQSDPSYRDNYHAPEDEGCPGVPTCRDGTRYRPERDA